MDKIEILIELTQEEADKIAVALNTVICRTEADEQLLSFVELSFRNATRDSDAKWRAYRRQQHSWRNKEN